jgi:hypothetical protein
VKTKFGYVWGVAVMDFIGTAPVEPSIRCDIMDVTAPSLSPVMIFVRNLECPMAIADHAAQGTNVAFSEVHPRAVWNGGLLLDTLGATEIGPFSVCFTLRIIGPNDIWDALVS